MMMMAVGGVCWLLQNGVGPLKQLITAARFVMALGFGRGPRHVVVGPPAGILEQGDLLV
jgi:hypothetical protein